MDQDYWTALGDMLFKGIITLVVAALVVGSAMGTLIAGCAG